MKQACLLACILGAAGCAALKPTPAVNGKEVNEARMTKGQLLQSDPNRMASLEIRDNLATLYVLMGKLYKRNPIQWKNSGFDTQEQAEARIKAAIEAHVPLPELGDLRNVAAITHALDPAFDGDRVGALIYGLGDMLVAAHGGKTDLYLLDGLDAQRVYNAARNVEIAMWMLAQRKDSDGQPLLVSNEISENGRNLSFEREFGTIIGRTDLVAAFVAEKYRRSVINYIQNLAGGQFLQFLPVEAASAAASAQ